MTVAKGRYPYEPDYVVPPGETLLEKIEELGMKQSELALRLGLSTKHVNRIIKGHEPITQETAIGLERVTNIPAHFWNNREAIYRERLARFKEAEKLKSDLKWLNTIPTKELIRREAIAEQSNKLALLQETLAFFGVGTVAACKKLWSTYKVAARRSRKIETQMGPTMAWLRLGELRAREIPCRNFDRKHFIEATGKIRNLTTEKADVFLPRMREYCADSGVALVIVPYIKGAPWYGASMWLTSNKAMIELSLRGKKDDLFWFSFFHEAGHVLDVVKKKVFINDYDSTKHCEENADKFAANILIPSTHIAVVRALTTKRSVVELAKSLQVSPGVVVGRFQRETRKWAFFNDLKREISLN